MDFKRIFFVVLLTAIAKIAVAGQVDNLYQINLTVPLEQTGEPAQDQIKSGLKQVLTKLTGRTDLSGNATLKAQLPVAADYLQQYRYQSIDTQNNSTASLQTLILDFNPVALKGLINHAGLKSLGAQRPTLLVWLVNDKNGTQDYLNAESDEITLFRTEAAKRGLPVQLPIFDLEDQTALPVSDLWGLFEQSIEQASARYVPDAILAARIQSSSSEFNQVEWLLIDFKSQRRSSAGTTPQVISEIVNSSADELFSVMLAPVRYNLSDLQAGIAINISGVGQFSDYLNVTDYLRTLPVVKTMKPEKINGSELRVRVELDGNTAVLQEALSLEPRLTAMDYTSNPDGTIELHYRWQN